MGRGIKLADVAFLGRVGTPTAFVPPDSGNLVLWLKPETLASAYANNDPIDPWNDSSGSGNHFIAENASFRPLFKTNQLNGYGGADFDGADDFLSKNSALGVTQTYTLFAVVKFDNAVAGSGREWIFKNGEGNGHGISKWDGDRHIFYNTGVFLKDAACTTNAEYWSAVRTSAPLAKLYVNGVLQGLTNDTAVMASPDANSRLGIFLNSTFPFDGKIFEIALYKTNLSDVDRQSWEAYLATKFAI